jgi:transposase
MRLVLKKVFFFSKRAFEGGSVRVWAGFSFYGKTEIILIEENLNAIRY